MVTRRQFLHSFAGMVAVPALAATPPSKATDVIPAGEAALFADIWGQKGQYFETLEIGADPRRSPYERVLSDTLNEVDGPDWKKVSWPMDPQRGHRVLRIHWDRNYRSGSFSIPLFRGHVEGNGDATEARIVHCRYMVRISENFQRAVVEGGKWLGFCSAGKPLSGRTPRWPNHPYGGRGTLLAGNGGGNIHGDDGWSARGGWRPGAKGSNEAVVPLSTYAYALDRELADGRIALHHEILKRYEEARGLAPGSPYVRRESLKPLLRPGEILTGASRTGTDFKWDYGNPAGALVPGQWHRVDQVMAINTPGIRDGWLHAYIDGRKVGHITKVRWRNAGPYKLNERYGRKTTLGIAAIWANFYQGGGDGYKKMTEEAQIDVCGVAVRVLEWDA